WNATELEDIYLPYKPKRKSRATTAIENGLEPLAKMLMAGNLPDPEGAAARSTGGDVKNTDEALQGARDIIAEWINESRHARNKLRQLYRNSAAITVKMVKGKEAEGEKYKDYAAYSEPFHKIPSHRAMAIFRGEKEGFLKVTIQPGKEEAIELLNGLFTSGKGN